MANNMVFMNEKLWEGKRSGRRKIVNLETLSYRQVKCDASIYIMKHYTIAVRTTFVNNLPFDCVQ